LRVTSRGLGDVYKRQGIHPTRFYAIPYRSKGNPLLDSNFSSCILTIYLTLYYYIVLHKYEINPFVFKCIQEFKIYTEIFEKEEPIKYYIEHITDMDLDFDFKIKKLFKILFKNIFERIKITSYQYNTSFVDIINIEGLYKIGYSGTINIDFPPIKSEYNFWETIPDNDEKINVHYAIKKSKLFFYNPSDTPYFYNTTDVININDYDAIIDAIGLFKNNNNQEIALELFNLFMKKRDVIFIDESNKKYVINNSSSETNIYNPNIFYKNPFIYYDQAHIVGVDIKQDKYPIMNGLCIINNLSIYSQIAQAMFRLRKLNMGHSIDFIYVTTKRTPNFTPDSILNLLLTNETENKNGKKINLLYQTLKSDIRKLRDEESIEKLYDEHHPASKSITYNYDLRYFEKIKYYFTKDEEIETDYLKAYDGILYDSELVDIHSKYCEYFEEIKNNINKLVYNIGSIQNSVELNYDQDVDLKIDTEKLQLVENQFNKRNDPLNINLRFEYITYIPIRKFSNMQYFMFGTIELSRHIRYLPNIFTQITGYDYLNNNSGYIFVYIHELILIIPGYLITYFYDNYPILNYKLNIMNDVPLKKRDRNTINRYKTDYFFQILYSTKYIPYNHIYKELNYICYKILLDRKSIFEYQKQFIEDYLQSGQFIIHENEIILKYDAYKTKVPFIEKFTTRELQLFFSQKYYLKAQKYKRKYLELKNLIN
jgi:hypothetical protein